MLSFSRVYPSQDPGHLSARCFGSFEAVEGDFATSGCKKQQVLCYQSRELEEKREQVCLMLLSG